MLNSITQTQSNIIEEETPFKPYEITCASCGKALTITEDIKTKGIVFCEKCGAQIQIA